MNIDTQLKTPNPDTNITPKINDKQIVLESHLAIGAQHHVGCWLLDTPDGLRICIAHFGCTCSYCRNAVIIYVSGDEAYGNWAEMSTVDEEAN